MTISAGKVSLTVLPDAVGFKALLKSALEGETGSFSALGKGVGGKIAEGIGVGLLAAGALSAKMAVEMSASDAKIQGNAQLTAKAATNIGDAFLKTAGTSVFSGHQMADAFAPVAGVIQAVDGRALSAADSLKVMDAAQNLAEASGLDLTTTTGALASIMRSYQIDAKGAADASNILFNTSRLTGLGVTDIANAANKLHARLGEASPTLKDTSTLILDLATHGVTGTRSLMVMQAGLTTLLSGGKVTNEVLKILGVTVYDAKGHFVGMQNVLGQLAPKLAGMTEQQRRATEQALFGKSAAGALNTTILAGAKGYEDATNSVSKKNAVDIAAKASAESLDGMMKKLRATVSDYATIIGEKVIPIVTSVVTWFDRHKAVAFALAGVVGTVMVAALGMWTAAVVKNSVTLAFQFVKMIAGWASTAVAAAASGAETVAIWSLYAAESIKGTATTVASLAVQGAKWVWSGVVAMAAGAQVAAAWLLSIAPIAIVIAVVAGIVYEIVKHWETIKHAVSTAVNYVLTFVKTHWVLLVELITGPIGFVVIQIAKHWSQITKATSEAIGMVINFFKELPGKILKALGDVGSFLFDSGKNLIMGLIHGIENLSGKVFDSIKGVVKGVLGHLHLGFLIQSPSKVTMTIGEQVMEGLANGISKGAGKANAAAKHAANLVIAEHKKMVAALAKDHAKVAADYLKMHTIIADALKSKADLIKNAATQDASAQASYNDAAFNLNRTFTQDKFKLDRDYLDKKNTLNRTYNEAIASATKTFDDTTKADLIKHNDAMLANQKTYNDKVTSLTEASATKQLSIIQKSRDLLTGAFGGATSVDVGSMFSSGTGGVSGLLESLKAKLDGAKTLASNAASLAAKGFSQTFIQQVVGQGSDIGNQMSEAILSATPEASAQLQSLYGQMQDVSEGGLNKLADQMSTSTKLATTALTNEYAQVAVDLKDSLAVAYTDLNLANANENAAFTATTAATLKTLDDAKASALQTLNNGLADAAKTYSDSLFDMNTTLSNGLFDADKSLKAAIKGTQTQFDTDIANLQTSTETRMTSIRASLQLTADLIAKISGSSAGASVMSKAPKTPTLVTAPSSGSMDMATAAARANAVASAGISNPAYDSQVPAAARGATSEDIAALGATFKQSLADQTRLAQTLARAGQ